MDLKLACDWDYIPDEKIAWDARLLPPRNENYQQPASFRVPLRIFPQKYIKYIHIHFANLATVQLQLCKDREKASLSCKTSKDLQPLSHPAWVGEDAFAHPRCPLASKLSRSREIRLPLYGKDIYGWLPRVRYEAVTRCQGQGHFYCATKGWVWDI